MRLTPKHLLGLKLALVVLVLYLGDLANIVCLVQPQYVPIGRDRLQGAGPLYFVPLDAFPRSQLERFGAFYRARYGLTITILPAISLSPRAFDPGRHQFVAEEIIRLIDDAAHVRGVGPESTVIAFTDHDIYIQHYRWKYAFGYRAGQRAVVSSAQMDHRFLGVWPIDAEWQETRLRKMATKYVGVLYYQLPMSTHCHSPLFGKIGGPQELDFMGEDI